jgi:hypothetical protein
MTRAAPSEPKRWAAFEPLYEVDQRTGATVEVFYAERVLAGMRGAEWFWWRCTPGCVPDWPPIAPFGTSYSTYRDAAVKGGRMQSAADASKAFPPIGAVRATRTFLVKIATRVRVC